MKKIPGTSCDTKLACTEHKCLKKNIHTQVTSCDAKLVVLANRVIVILSCLVLSRASKALWKYDATVTIRHKKKRLLTNNLCQNRDTTPIHRYTSSAFIIFTPPAAVDVTFFRDILWRIVIVFVRHK